MKEEKKQSIRSIRSQLLIYIGIFVVFPLCLGLFLLNLYLQKTINENNTTFRESALSQIKDNADQIIEVTNYSTSILMLNQEILENLRIVDHLEDSYQSYRAKMDISNRLLEMESSVLGAFNGKMAILTNSGYLIGSHNLSKTSLSVEEEEWYQKILKNGRKTTFCAELSVFFQEMTASTINDYECLYLGRTILDYAGEKRGILLVQISELKIWKKIIENMNTSGKGSFFILNDDLEIQMKYNAADEKIEEDLYQICEKLQENPEQKIKQTVRNGYCYFIVPLSHRNNMLIYTIPEAILREESNGVSKSIFLLILLLILLTICTMIYFSGKLSKPLKSLAEMLEESDSGILRIQPPRNSFKEIEKFIFSYNHAGSRIQELISRVKKESHLKEKAHYETLMSQISPHFIFNTVNTIRLMAKEGDPKTERALEALGEILHAVYRNKDGMTTVGEETALLEAYVEIMKVRFGNSFQYYNGIPTELYFYEIPAFTMQPIVENAILHGVKDIKAGQIIVSAVEYQNDFVIIIFNNGNSEEKEFVEHLINTPQKNRRSFTGIGLYNVNLRLKMLYGDSYGLIFNEKIKNGFEIWIRMPKRKIETRGEKNDDSFNCGR